MNLQNGVEGFLAAITLGLFNANHLSGSLGFHTEEVQVEVVNFLGPFSTLDVIRLPTLLYMARNLIGVAVLVTHFSPRWRSEIE